MPNNSATSYELPRHPRVWWSRVKYRWPFVVWLGSILLVGWLYLDSGRTTGLSGVVEVLREEAAPMEAARLTSVAVVTGQDVKPGDLLAEFDTSVLDAEMAEIEAQLALDQLQTERQFSRAVSDAETRLRELKLQQATDQNRLDALRTQMKGFDQVMDSAASDVRAVAMYRAEELTLSRNIALYPDAVRGIEDEVAQAREQMAFARKASAPEATRNLLASLEQRKQNYTLRVRKAGVVSRVLRSPGDVVREADPVVSIVVVGSQQIIGFVPEWQAHDVIIGEEAWITRPLRSGNALKARVTTVGPEILGLPTRVSPVPGQTIRGRRIVLVIEDANDYLPGEGVTIHMNQPWWIKKYQTLLERYASN